MKKGGLHRRIFIGMAIGLVAGLSLNVLGDHESAAFEHTIWWLDLLGKDIFIGALMMIIAPLIFASIVSGISTLPNMREFGAIGLKTMAYYVCTTTLAVAIGITAVLVVRPGHKEASEQVRERRVAAIDQYRETFRNERGQDPDENPGAFREFVAEEEGEGLAQTEDFTSQWDRIQTSQQMGPGEMFRRQILLPLLTNPFTSLAQSPPNSLGIIFFALLTGLACLATGESGRRIAHLFQGFNDVILKITLWVMEIAPLAIGCIIASLTATLGLEALRSLGWYCLTVILGIACHVVALLVIVALVGRRNPLTFLRGISEAWLIGFTTTSSAATLPVTLHCTTKKLKVSEKVADFNLPLGATINMDGTALYEGVAVIFLIQMYGGLPDVPIELTPMKTFIIFITAVLASVGAAAVPSAGLITMAIVASAVGLPLYYIYFIYAVDHVLDMFRTSTNILGDAVGAVVVNRLEEGRLGEATTR